jgi:integrase
MKLRKGMEKERQLFTTEEINILLNEAKQNDLINSCKCMYPFLLFSLTTGCRRGEICALKWDDINTEKMTCVISKSIAVVSNKGGKPNEYISSTKNKKVRTVPINEKLLEEILKLKQYNSDFIFSDYRNRRRFISPRTISNTYRRLQKKTGINKSIHVFRHQFISNALEKGISLKAVQLVVGHASLNVTGRYWHPEAESLNEIRNLYIES